MRFIAMTTLDHTARLSRVADWTETATLGAHGERVVRATFFPDR